MKVLNRKEFSYEDVNVGNSFFYNGELFIKPSLGHPVNLVTGESTKIDPQTHVCIVNAEVVI